MPLPDPLANAKAMSTLDLQLDLINFWRTDRGRQFAAGFVDHERGRRTLLDPVEGGQLGPILATSLDQSTTFWCSRDMEEIVVALAREACLPSRLDPTDLLAPRGFVMFDAPIEFFDASDQIVQINALQWGPARDREGNPGLFVASYTDILRSTKDWNVLEAKAEGYFDELPRLWLLGVDPSSFGELPEINEDVRDHGPHPFLLAQAFNLIAAQRVAVRSGRRVGRPAARRLERFGSRGMIPEVNIVTLRREVESHVRPKDEQDEGVVLWSHRWIVRGHWAHQAYGKGFSQHRWIWKDAYIKGPENLPIVVKDQVNKLVR